MRFLFFYLMHDEPDRVAQVAPRHAQYWQELALPRYLGGPFADRSGGLITFDARSASHAEQLAHGDPFLHEGLLRSWWLKEWLSGPTAPPTSPAGLP